MLRAALEKRLICISFFPFNFSSNDNASEKSTDISKTRIALDRFKDFVYDEKGYPTKEAQSVINGTLTGFGAGFFLGAIVKIKDASERYKLENQATVYENKYQAQKELQHVTTKAMLKGGFKIGLRLGTFCFCFSSILAGLYVYRAKFDIFNSMCAGAGAGFLFKVNMGLKGSIAGTVLGAILGTVYGSCTALLLWITGTNMNNLYVEGARIMNMRRDKIRERKQELKNNEESELKQAYEANQRTTHLKT